MSIWATSGQQSLEWLEADVMINSTAERIRFVGTMGVDSGGIGLDNIKIEATKKVSDIAEVSCDFEFDSCAWNVLAPWTRELRLTPEPWGVRSQSFVALTLETSNTQLQSLIFPAMASKFIFSFWCNFSASSNTSLELQFRFSKTRSWFILWSALGTDRTAAEVKVLVPEFADALRFAVLRPDISGELVLELARFGVSAARHVKSGVLDSGQGHNCVIRKVIYCSAGEGIITVNLVRGICPMWAMIPMRWVKPQLPSTLAPACLPPKSLLDTTMPAHCLVMAG